MTTVTKLSWRTRQSDQARALVGALENLVVPVPDAVTQFEDGEGGWRVETYISDLADPQGITEQLKETLGEAAAAPEVEAVPDLNWVALSQAALPPVAAGRFVVHGSHDRNRIPHGPNAILIDAGEAFGTAHHATTLGCLLAIDHLTRRRRFSRVLDLGCGSGVLAIATSRALPLAQIIATDNDPLAVAVASENARANGAHRIAFSCASGLDHPWLRHTAPFDLIIANILAGPLCHLAPDIRRAIRPGAALILSGILNPEASEVIAAYMAQGFALKEHRRIAGWSTLTLLKRG